MCLTELWLHVHADSLAEKPEYKCFRVYVTGLPPGATITRIYGTPKHPIRFIPGEDDRMILRLGDTGKRPSWITIGKDRALEDFPEAVLTDADAAPSEADAPSAPSQALLCTPELYDWFHTIPSCPTTSHETPDCYGTCNDTCQPHGFTGNGEWRFADQRQDLVGAAPGMAGIDGKVLVAQITTRKGVFPRVSLNLDYRTVKNEDVAVGGLEHNGCNLESDAFTDFTRPIRPCRSCLKNPFLFAAVMSVLSLAAMVAYALYVEHTTAFAPGFERYTGWFVMATLVFIELFVLFCLYAKLPLSPLKIAVMNLLSRSFIVQCGSNYWYLGGCLSFTMFGVFVSLAAAHSYYPSLTAKGMVTRKVHQSSELQGQLQRSLHTLNLFHHRKKLECEKTQVTAYTIWGKQARWRRCSKSAWSGVAADIALVILTVLFGVATLILYHVGSEETHPSVSLFSGKPYPQYVFGVAALLVVVCLRLLAQYWRAFLYYSPQPATCFCNVIVKMLWIVAASAATSAIVAVWMLTDSDIVKAFSSTVALLAIIGFPFVRLWSANDFNVLYVSWDCCTPCRRKGGRQTTVQAGHGGSRKSCRDTLSAWCCDCTGRVGCFCFRVAWSYRQDFADISGLTKGLIPSKKRDLQIGKDRQTLLTLNPLFLIIGFTALVVSNNALGMWLAHDFGGGEVAG